jgi:LPPG:FO 2-phospho-L-lactate transferase
MPPPPQSHERAAPPAPIVALCGGVGAARFLRGLVRAVPAQDVVAIVNTGDDRTFYDVLVTPDLDIVTYTLAGVVDLATGYGLRGDTYTLMDRLEELGHEVWFRLGDRDFANCLHRTLRLAQGTPLGRIVDELAHSYGMETRLLPMSESACPTMVELRDGRSMHFEEYMIRERSPDCVSGVDLSAAKSAKPTPGVLESLTAARLILFCPSNPVVSIGPIVSIPGVREAVIASSAKVVAVSPIVGGAPIKGPASQLLRGIGVEVSALGVAGHYADLIDGFVLDQKDRDHEAAIRDLGLATRVIDTIMLDDQVATGLAEAAIELGRECA